MNDVVMRFQKLNLLPEGLRVHEASIQREVAGGGAGRERAVIIYDCVSGGGCDAVEASGVMEGRIYDAL
jgi:hypothetical protein